MKFNRSIVVRAVVLISLMASLTFLSSKMQADTGSCGGVTITLPFTDVMGNAFFCQIAGAYFSGLTNGTSPTTFSPTQNVTREQMAAFATRTLDQSLKRGSKRAVAKKWWNPQDIGSVTLTDLGTLSMAVEFDGRDLWVARFNGTISRISPGDGKVLETWTGVPRANGILAAMGKIFVIGLDNPGRLHMIDPAQPAGSATLLSNSLGNNPLGVAFDGSRIWTANGGNAGVGRSVSIVSLNPTTVTTVSTGFITPYGILYDGSHIWVTDHDANTLLKLNSDGSIAQTVSVGISPRHMVFDGTNVWVANAISNSVSVVRVKDADGNPLTTAFVLATLRGNGLRDPFNIAFDGERILVTNPFSNVSFWQASDLKPLGSFETGPTTDPAGACSDGLNFWVILRGSSKLARF